MLYTVHITVNLQHKKSITKCQNGQNNISNCYEKLFTKQIKYINGLPVLILRVVSSFPPGDRRESSARAEKAREKWGEVKKARGPKGGRREGEKEKEKRRLQTIHC